MRCPECGSRTKLINRAAYQDHTWRRRECQENKHRFTTLEYAAETLNAAGQKHLLRAVHDAAVIRRPKVGPGEKR